MALKQTTGSKIKTAGSREKINTVNEPVGYYESKPDTAGILLNVSTKPESRMTAIEKLHLSRAGISKQALEQLKHATGLDYDRLAKGLSVTKATLFSKKGKEKFGADLSEKIISLADIYSYGYTVFGDQDLFNRWMHHPNQALGGETPYTLVDNQFGREEVKNMVGRIAYGVYS